MEQPGLLLVAAFVIAQLIASVIAATVSSEIFGIRAIGWRWTGALWAYNFIIYILLDPIKLGVRYALSGKAWNLVLDKKAALTRQRNFGREAREAAWAREQRTLHGLQTVEPNMISFSDNNQMAEEARRRAEIASLVELHTLKGKVESVAKLKGLDIKCHQLTLHSVMSKLT